MLSKEEIEKAWQLLGGRGFDSLCAFADDYAIKLLEDHEYLIGEVERLSKCQSCGGVGYVELSHDPYMTSTCECVIFEQAVEDYPKLKLRNQQLQKALEWYADKKNYDLYVDSDFINQNNANDDSGERARRALKGDETK